MYPTVRTSIQAFILMLIFLGSFAVREGHFLLAHTHHHERCVTSEGQFHFHGEEFAPEKCDLCTLQAFASDLPPYLVQTKAFVANNICVPTIHIQPDYRNTKMQLPALRGPPVV